MELGGAQVWGGGSASPGVWPGIKQGAACSSLHGNSTKPCSLPSEWGPSGTKGQRPTWLPCPASLSRCGGDRVEGNPSQDIDFNFLRIKKKPNQNRQKLPENSFLPHNFTEISLETSSARTCSRLCLSPPAQPPWHRQCQPQGSAPHPQHVPSAGHSQTLPSLHGSWEGSRRAWTAPVGS